MAFFYLNAMEDNIKSITKTNTISHGSLGKEIKISPKSHVYFNKAGAEFKFVEESVEVLIGIGSDNTARLIMGKSDWESLKNGEEISIDTIKDFKKKFIKK